MNIMHICKDTSMMSFALTCFHTQDETTSGSDEESDRHEEGPQDDPFAPAVNDDEEENSAASDSEVPPAEVVELQHSAASAAANAPLRESFTRLVIEEADSSSDQEAAKDSEGNDDIPFISAQPSSTAEGHNHAESDPAPDSIFNETVEPLLHQSVDSERTSLITELFGELVDVCMLDISLLCCILELHSRLSSALLHTALKLGSAVTAAKIE